MYSVRHLSRSEKRKRGTAFDWEKVADTVSEIRTDARGKRIEI
jgi:hypothetical protein